MLLKPLRRTYADLALPGFSTLYRVDAIEADAGDDATPV